MQVMQVTVGVTYQKYGKIFLKCTEQNLKRPSPFVRCGQMLTTTRQQGPVICKRLYHAKQYVLHILVCKDT